MSTKYQFYSWKACFVRLWHKFLKVCLVPTRRIVFFGLIIDTVQFKVFLTDEKIDKIISFGKFILKQHPISIWTHASFIGLIVHAFNAVTFGPLHYKALEREKISNLQSRGDNFDNTRIRVIIFALCSTLHIYLIMFQISINSIPKHLSYFQKTKL